MSPLWRAESSAQPAGPAAVWAMRLSGFGVHLGPQAYRAGDLEREGRGEKKRGFGCGPSGWSRTIRRFGRSGTASSSGSRRGSRGSIGSFRRSRVSSNARFLRPRPQLALVYRIQQAPAPRRSPPRCPSVARDQGLDSQQKAWSGLVKPGRPWPCFAPRGSRGHFMDNEDTRVPTVHIESGGPIIDDTQLEHWGEKSGGIPLRAAHPRPTNSHTTPSP